MTPDPTRWPWFTMVLAAIALFNPIGLGFVDAAFLSTDQLSRNIARPIVLVAAAVLLAAGVLEWWLRSRSHGR
jgi:hypothetical protein